MAGGREGGEGPHEIRPHVIKIIRGTAWSCGRAVSQYDDHAPCTRRARSLFEASRLELDGNHQHGTLAPTLRGHVFADAHSAGIVRVLQPATSYVKGKPQVKVQCKLKLS